MKGKKITASLLGCIILGITSMHAQITGTLPSGSMSATGKQLKMAKELFNNKLYQSALGEFNKLAQQCKEGYGKKNTDITEIEGYKTLCLINLNTPNCWSAVKAYEESYPHSTMLGKIKFSMAVSLFENKRFAQALTLLESIDKRALSKEEREEFTFRKGYCQMRTGNNGAAINTFNAIIKGESDKYIWPSLYYSGYLHYANKEFAKAVPLFERAKNDSRFTLLSRYHLLESKFFLKEYSYVTENGPALYRESDNNYRSKIARIISEAYYAMDDTQNAKYYFELYTMSGANLSKTDNFYAGMLAYTLNSHLSATDAFAKIASSTDSIGQSAAYHLGQSYIQLKNKHEAQKAFKLASESSFDKAIQEDAFFNYAKLSFDINRDMAPFGEYLKSYSYTNRKWDEIHSYMATGFLMNGNYTYAIEALRKIRNHTPATTVNLQKASFFRAIQLIRSGSYSNALPYLQESVKHSSYNRALKNLAEYWAAECYYRKDQFSTAEEILSKLHKDTDFRNSSEYPTSIFNMAYCKFKEGNYTGAAERFKEYLSLPAQQRIYSQEANTRLADCHFMAREYQTAAEMYEKIAVGDGYRKLYAPLQSAIAYGLVGDNTKKAALLQEITGDSHKGSPLYTTALYELGRTYVQNVEDAKAEAVLDKLINKPKDSTYFYRALLEMGMINSNRKEYDKALEHYKTIVENVPASEEAQSALAGIENIYQVQNNPAEFIKYLDNIGLSGVKTEDEKENMLFNAAEQIFLSENYTEALAALNSFVSRYPQGNRLPQAYFYIAESYNNLGKQEKAADYYYKVMESGAGAFSEIATLNYGRLSYSLERFQEAVNAYETLDKIAQLENNRLEAKTGLIKSYFMCRNYEQTLIETDAMLKSGSTRENIKLAKYYKAKSHLALGEREAALVLLKEISKELASSEGAEAAYLLISDAYDAGDFESVEKQTFALSESATPQTYWLAKSFIVLGDSYAERGNLEQAEATFNSIKENYTPLENDDIPDLLKIRLDKLAQMKKQ